ncbi:Clavaminate synthase-like protein [Tothia fuscella]|uniref:Clavaminate synthase-like protein n=1 Tax=Tothia fuscella TaxID=1048955 RepID=A0A9P4NNZ3_9PEZI|nr:Clavaminate synthase-like protein [Tothia fuscella]
MLTRQLPFRAVFKNLPSFTADNVPLFRSTHFKPESPVAFQQQQFTSSIPAIRKWLLPLKPGNKDTALTLNEKYFDSQPDVSVPLERTTNVPLQDSEQEAKGIFERLEAPLSLFTAWTTKKLLNPSVFEPNTSLYLAQCDLPSLPPQLQLDLPPLKLVLEAGKGDIYASSLWMGVPPTNTPLHRDPNPNLLIQLAGRKVVRMIRPQFGRAVYQHTRQICAEVEGSQFSGGDIRGDEMMVGLERNILDDFMWNDGHESSRDVVEVEGYDTTLEAGDGVFIPKGWWHSVRGVGTAEDGINASVNWWFR